MDDQHRINKSFKVGERVWLRLNKEGLQGLSNKIKAMWYSPFKILEKFGDDAYRLNLRGKMSISILTITSSWFLNKQ